MRTQQPLIQLSPPETTSLGQWQVSTGQPGHPHPQMGSPVMGAGILSDKNPLLKMAMPLITLITQIRHTVDHPDVPSLKNQVVEEIRKFEKAMTSMDYPVRLIIAARYCLCTAIDETVLGRSWGTQSIWVQESLLSLIHNETWGGERFYIILEDMLRNVRQNIDFVELIYVLISLGFEGKFFGDEQSAAREEIRHRIFYYIRQGRNKPSRALSSHWKIDKLPSSTKERQRKLKKVGTVTLAVLLAVAGYYNLKVYHEAKPMLSQLSEIARVSPITTFSQVINRSIVLRNNT